MAASQSPTNSINLERLINPTERQNEFLAAIAKHDYVLYGGAAGGGKSYILRWWLVTFLYALFKFRGLRNVQVGLFCEDYPSLYDRQISKIKFEFPHELGDLKEGVVKNFQLRPEFGGGMIALRNLDDPSKYQSAEFAAIAVDELTKNSKETFDFLRFRMRWPGLEHPKFAGASNPGGIGHAWVKKLWKDRIFPHELEIAKDQFKFVQAKASDNPHLNESYYRAMLTLPPEMAKKFADGDWNVFSDQFFTNFTEARHVISADEAKKRMQPWHKKWLAGDWGHGHPHCIHWFNQDEHGCVIMYREQWARGMNEDDLGQRIGQMSGNEKLISFPFSWDAGKLSKRSNPQFPKSINQMLSDALPKGHPKPHPADSSPGSRIAGARLMSQLFDTDLLLISEDCPKLIECLPTLIKDPKNIEDVLKVDFNSNELGDDPYDSARMGLQNMLSAPRKPLEVVKTEEQTALHGQLARLLRMQNATN